MTEVIIVFVVGGMFIGALVLIKTIMSTPVNITITHNHNHEPPVMQVVPTLEIDKATQDELDKKATFDSVVTALNNIMTGGDSNG